MHATKNLVIKLDAGNVFELEVLGRMRKFIHLRYVTYRGQEYALASGTRKHRDKLFGFTVTEEEGEENFDFVEDDGTRTKLADWYTAQYENGGPVHSIVHAPSRRGATGYFDLRVDGAVIEVGQVGSVDVGDRHYVFLRWLRPLDPTEPNELLLITVFVAEYIDGEPPLFLPVDADELQSAILSLQSQEETGQSLCEA